MNKIKKIISVAGFIIVLSPLVLLAQAMPGPSPTQPGSTEIGVKIDNPFNGGNDLMALIRAILSNIVMPIAAVAVVVWIVWAGFQFVLAQGKPAEIQKAKLNLLWSLVGAGILLGAAAISVVIENTVRALMN